MESCRPNLCCIPPFVGQFEVCWRWRLHEMKPCANIGHPPVNKVLWFWVCWTWLCSACGLLQPILVQTIHRYNSLHWPTRCICRVPHRNFEQKRRWQLEYLWLLAESSWNLLSAWAKGWMWLNDSATVTTWIFFVLLPSPRFKDPMGVVPVASHSYLEWNGAEPCWTVPCCNAPRKAHAARVSATVRWPRSPPDPGAKERRNEGSMSSHSTLSSIGKGVHEESAAESACIQCLSKLRYDTDAMRPTSRTSWLRTALVSRFIAIYGQAPAPGGQVP